MTAGREACATLSSRLAANPCHLFPRQSITRASGGALTDAGRRSVPENAAGSNAPFSMTFELARAVRGGTPCAFSRSGASETQRKNRQAHAYRNRASPGFQGARTALKARPAQKHAGLRRGRRGQTLVTARRLLVAESDQRVDASCAPRGNIRRGRAYEQKQKAGRAECHRVECG